LIKFDQNGFYSQNIATMSVQEMSTAKSKKTKKVVEEPESCGVCMDNYTPIIRKKCVCKYCKADTCSKCIERYLLERHEDAHCLHCRVNYNDITLSEICTKTYVQHVYFKHRQEVLINRERANLPGLQDAAILEKQKRDNEEKIKEINKEVEVVQLQRDKVMTDYNLLYTQYYAALAAKQDTTATRKKLDALLLSSDNYRKTIADKRDKIAQIRYPAAYGLPANGGTHAKPEEEKKKFIRRCTRDNCQGFLSTAWKCGICDYYSCSKCFVTKTKKQDDPHECKKEDIETAEMIKADCKPCPNCGEFIMKSSGCFAKDTPILLWNGSTKMSQDIRVGDELVGDDGLKRTVLDTTTGVDMMYEVKQNSGMTYVVNSKHTLVLKKTTDNGLLEEIEIIVDNYLKLDDTTKKTLFGFKLKYPSECVKMSIEVSEVGLGEYFGWKVDCNSKFVLSDLTTCHNCDQMWCISCQTPFSWTSGKVVTGGAIHNPHYYEWMRRNGQAMDRNPLDVPCGGYPNAWELRRMPKGMTTATANKFFEFHRICQELQDISGRTYRSHIDQTTTSTINVKFLLSDFDEKHWGQLLGKNERKRKRDREVQEIFAAFRMVAVELINRVQNYRSEDGKIRSFTDLPIKEAEVYITGLSKEIEELIKMINDGLRNVSISFNYSVPYIAVDGQYYSIKTKNFSDEVKKKRGAKKEEEDDDETASTVTEPVNENVVKITTKLHPNVLIVPAPAPAVVPMPAVKAIEKVVESVEKVIEAVRNDAKTTTEKLAAIEAVTKEVIDATQTINIKRKKPVVAPTPEDNIAEELGEDADLQAAIAASLGK
jgi:hypothetical protein